MLKTKIDEYCCFIGFKQLFWSLQNITSQIVSYTSIFLIFLTVLLESFKRPTNYGLNEKVTGFVFNW